MRIGPKHYRKPPLRHEGRLNLAARRRRRFRRRRCRTMQRIGLATTCDQGSMANAEARTTGSKSSRPLHCGACDSDHCWSELRCDPWDTVQAKNNAQHDPHTAVRIGEASVPGPQRGTRGHAPGPARQDMSAAHGRANCRKDDFAFKL